MASKSLEQLNTAKDFFQKSFPNAKPTTAVILGSGLGSLADEFKTTSTLTFTDLPYMVNPSIEGHDGKIFLADLPNGRQVIFFKGRLHAYEGHDYHHVMFLVRWAHLIGCKSLIVTNAAGSVNLDFHPGDLVLINDHINLSGKNPLAGPNIEELGPRFPDMSTAYDLAHREKMLKIAADKKITLKQGTYGYVMGPTYETPAEIKMLRILGADMVGMSTVPDVIAARHVGMKVLAISCITNYGSGINGEPLRHEDVKVEAMKSREKMKTLLDNFLH